MLFTYRFIYLKIWKKKFEPQMNATGQSDDARLLTHQKKLKKNKYNHQVKIGTDIIHIHSCPVRSTFDLEFQSDLFKC